MSLTSEINTNQTQNLITQYKSHLTSQSKSPNTINSYIPNITQYFNLYPTLSRPNIQSYIQHLQSNQLSSTTINQKLSSLKSFNEYLLSNGLINSLHIIKQDFIKQQSTGNPTEITTKDLEIFISNLNSINCVHKIRNIAIIYLILNSGIRREEITNLKLKNLDLNKSRLLVIGKGNKQRIVSINQNLKPILSEYIQYRSAYKFSNSPYIFLSERGEKLDKRTINRIFNKYNTKVKNKITPHQLRHYWASDMLENGVLSLAELQNQLGHSSISTTGMYTHARLDNIERRINSHFIG